MKKIILTAVIVATLLVGAFYAFNAYIYNEKQAPAEASYQDAEYRIDGISVQLKGGMAQTEAAPGAASKITTKYFGNDYMVDLDKDGRQDVVFLVTQEAGSSGTFFYVVAALNTERGYVGTEGYLLGDRIAPQSIELSQNPQHKDVMVVNYADRVPGEPMTTPPSVGKSAYLKLDPTSMSWGIVESSFEGEADSGRMTLGMKEWVWQKAEYNDGRTITPVQPGVFTLTFTGDGQVAVGTDCNSAGGGYVAEDGQLTFSSLRTTLMYCEGSQETEFLKLLQDTTSFHFTGNGELIFDLKYDSGTVTFK